MAEMLAAEIAAIESHDEKVAALNDARFIIHQVSPYKDEPVDFVEWVKNEEVHANDYNPNSVAPPEMGLLRLSIAEDGLTQPIVSFPLEQKYREVVDGFHRNSICREEGDIQSKLFGYMPLVSIRSRKKDKASRMASTIRHNRARGSHAIRSMSDIVLEFVNLGWNDEQIGKHLGMQPEEVFRLKQITGLKSAFANQEFSKSWTEFISKTNP